MNVMKLGFLIFLVSIVVDAAPVQDDLVIAATVDDVDGGHRRESRSSSARRLKTIPWHLDRIDQQRPPLDRKYNAFASGKATI